MNSTYRLAPLLPALLAAFVTCAHADFQARGASGLRGDKGAAGRQAGAVGDGNGNAAGGYRGGFATDKAYGQRSGYFTRGSDGAASAGRSTTATNKETGVTYSGTTTWEKGSGVSREASCKDASGNTVACGEAR